MARRPYLPEKQRLEWIDLLILSEKHYKKYIEPSELYGWMYANNAAHWAEPGGAGAWPYDVVTANLTYVTLKSLQASTLMRHPKVLVKPHPMATGRANRLGAQPATVRWESALHVQQLMNWRVREFDFLKQIRRVQQDDYLRGMGVIRHGYAAPEDVSYYTRSKLVEYNHHQHIRAGWPFAVHWPLRDYRFDPLAREPDERQWAAYRTLWRMEDLKEFNKVVVPADLSPSMIVGIDPEDDTKVKSDALRNQADTLSRVPIWEIWDRRTKRVIYWAPSISKEIGVEDWPLDWEGLPDSILLSNPQNDKIAPVAEQDHVHELQQQLNKLLSMVLMYAKRGVPIIAVRKGQLDEDEIEKITDAEILEIIRTKVNPAEAVAMHNLNPPLGNLLMAIEKVQQLHREVQGQGRIEHGMRENVESATEAAGIIEASGVRSRDRQQAIQEFFSRVIRKDFQVIQQTATEDQYLDVVDTNKVPQLLMIGVDEIRQEYDFDIEVGSTQPDDEFRRKQDGLQIAALMDSPIGLYFDPAFIAREVAARYGLDMAEALVPREQAVRAKFWDAYSQAISNRGAGGGRSSNGSIGAALDSTKATPDQNAERNTL